MLRQINLTPQLINGPIHPNVAFLSMLGLLVPKIMAISMGLFM